jgi:hypothetical protein
MRPWQSDTEKYRQEFFSRVWPAMNGIQWDKPDYSVEKAYVCAMFSKLAYLKIPEQEITAAPSVKLVPCLTYQRMFAQRASFDFDQYVRTLDLVGVVPHFTDRLVTIVVPRPTVIFVAIRGTRILHANDVLIDIDARRIGTSLDLTPIKFHRGFYLEITKNLEPISNAIRNCGTDIPVYVVGHSLGGAMAAIMCAVAGRTFDTVGHFEQIGTANVGVHSSFTFGMPRYGNTDALALRTPFHLYNERDAIPTVPPRWFGFSNAAAEYRLSEGRRSIVYGPRAPGGFKSLMRRVNWGRGIRHHFIERYIRRLV